MDYSVKVFCLKKGFVKLMIRLKRNTAQCAFAELLCAFKYSHWFNYSMFFKKQMFFILLSFLYFNQGRRSCPRASCTIITLLQPSVYIIHTFWMVFLFHFLVAVYFSSWLVEELLFLWKLEEDRKVPLIWNVRKDKSGGKWFGINALLRKRRVGFFVNFIPKN